LKNTLGELFSKGGFKQLRIAETEKKAHVTYFFSGEREQPFVGEERIIIPIFLVFPPPEEVVVNFLGITAMLI